MDLELNKTHNINCIEGMKLLDDDCIDLTVTSPPYDDLRSYKGYIKFISPNLNSKIDNVYLNKIQEIFERGVFIA